MGNIDIFEMMANRYDSTERIQIAKVTSDAIRKFLVDANDKNALDFGCGTGLWNELVKRFQFYAFSGSIAKYD